MEVGREEEGRREEGTELGGQRADPHAPLDPSNSHPGSGQVDRMLSFLVCLNYPEIVVNSKF